MGNKAVSKEARRAAREAAAAAAEEIIRRTKANVEDLAAFFDARDRADTVDEWLAERHQALRGQAAQRRSAHRLQCGTALWAMRDRGEALREIAHMAGISEKAVRELIREAESPQTMRAPAQVTVDSDTAVLPERAPESLGPSAVSAHETKADRRARESASAPA